MKRTKLKKGVYLQERENNFSIVYPFKEEDGSINWKNTLIGGSWGRFFSVILFISFLLFLSWSYRHDVNECYELIENPESYCIAYFNYKSNPFGNFDGEVIIPNELNLSKNPFGYSQENK